ncbi:MAG: acetylglutamate kinase [Firmicutes bacterium]|nr:acetylglutamate kinase [Bacillota bacterium]MBQ4092651.1 acetylglutamate kinase [Bacillota bacterium]MBQ6809807.1 acetylglutamate kinase [Bacillota bacterium]
MEENLKKAQHFIECLPYVQKFHGKTIVVKYGGNAMLNEELKEAVFRDIILMNLIGIRTVLVHGGGPDIEDYLNRLHIKSDFKGGLRVTNEDVMETVSMVLVGKVNQNTVSEINRLGGKAVGLSGKDGAMLKCVKKYAKVKGEDGLQHKIDIGMVGEVEDVDCTLINNLLADMYIPVIAPIGTDEDGHTYNVNADIAAGKIASALGAMKLFLLTDVEGLYRDFNDKSSLITRLTADEVSDLVKAGAIKKGMIPKLESCVNAIHAGVENVHIIDGRVPHSLLLELFTDSGVGTMMTKEPANE